jgi:ribosomal protein L3 glutamine methyltransferase
MNQPDIKPQTIGDWINQANARFEAANLTYGHGTDNAWDEAVQAVLFALGLPVDSDQGVLQQPVSSADGRKIAKLIDDRINTRKPLPYLTHCAWFMGMPFYVDERVLIPRSPFAEWIERAFSPWIDADKVKNILDIGTGSGCLAIGCALTFPKAQVDAVDINKDALAVAAINVATYQLQNVHLIQSDCFAAVPQKQYDVIISNPPYVGEAEMAELPQEYRHEPELALVAENEGLAIVDRILAQASRYLTQHGILLIEVGYNADLLQAKYPRVPFIWLEQERGGEGLFLITKAQLDLYVGK